MIEEKIYKEETMEELDSFFNNPNFAHFVGMLCPPRPGFQLCIVRLEHTYFPPGSDLNKDFIIHLVEWEKIAWAIISIPKSEMDLMEKVANETGLRITNKVSKIVTGRGIQIFPINIPDSFYFENVIDHPVYGNNLEKTKRILEDEQKEIKEILRKAKEKRTTTTNKH